MISRPIVISLLFYLFFSPNTTIILTGILFEVYGVIDIPVGTHIPKDDSFATYASAITIIYGNISDSLHFLLMILLSLVLMYFATMADGYTRKINRILYNKIEKRNIFAPNYLIYVGIVVSFIKGVLVYNLGTIILLSLIHYVTIESDANIGLYASLLITVAASYFIEYFEIFGFKKYFFIICGFIVGWIIT
jgi:PTS system mannose-specific IIC component